MFNTTKRALKIGLGVLLLFSSASTLFADLSISLVPTMTIEGEDSQLERPEGFRFSPSGDCIAVTNSEGDSITFYRRKGNRGCEFETSPACVIHNADVLCYPHDLAFSSSGLYIVVASRDNDSIVFFKRESLDDLNFSETPYAIIKGLRSKLNVPAGVSFSPDDRLLAVANRKDGGLVTFYRLIDETTFTYTSDPIYEIPASVFLDHGINACHDLAFSPDGKSLAIVHKKYDIGFDGKSALMIFEIAEMPNGEISCHPSFIHSTGFGCLHSVSYHPSGDYLAISSENDKVWIFKKEKESNTFSLYTTIFIDKRGNATEVKGVDFSPSEECMAITTVISSNTILIHEISDTNHR